MAFFGTLAEKMYVPLLVDDGETPTPWMCRKQLPLFLTKKQAAEFLLQQKPGVVPENCRLGETQNWENVLGLLQRAERMGADSVVLFPAGQKPRAGTIQEAIENVQAVVDGDFLSPSLN